MALVPGPSLAHDRRNMAFLIFIGCLAGIALFGFVVSKITGAKAQYLETFPLDPGERVLWEDLATDAYPIRARRGLITTYRHSRRRALRVTNLRIICACTPLFGSQHMIEHVLYPADRPFPEEGQRLGGGLLTKGYSTLVFERETAVTHTRGIHGYVELDLARAVESSLGLLKFRIYSAHLERFTLPE